MEHIVCIYKGVWSWDPPPPPRPRAKVRALPIVGYFLDRPEMGEGLGCMVNTGGVTTPQEYRGFPQYTNNAPIFRLKST